MTDPLFLLDSNILIYVLEGLGSALRSRLESQQRSTVVTSAICHAEVMRGIALDDVERNAKAERLFAVCPVMPFDQKAGFAYRELPFRRHSFDRLIAAHALSLGLTLVTANESDFADIPGLRVENWTV